MMIRDSMFDAMTQLLRRAGVADVTEVVAAEPDRRTRGADSDEYTEVLVRIWYRTTGGAVATYEYLGDFGALIRELTD
jgi:hypothetical protein